MYPESGSELMAEGYFGEAALSNKDGSTMSSPESEMVEDGGEKGSEQ